MISAGGYLIFIHQHRLNPFATPPVVRRGCLHSARPPNAVNLTLYHVGPTQPANWRRGWFVFWGGVGEYNRVHLWPTNSHCFPTADSFAWIFLFDIFLFLIFYQTLIKITSGISMRFDMGCDIYIPVCHKWAVSVAKHRLFFPQSKNIIDSEVGFNWGLTYGVFGLFCSCHKRHELRCSGVTMQLKGYHSWLFWAILSPLPSSHRLPVIPPSVPFYRSYFFKVSCTILVLVPPTKPAPFNRRSYVC